MIKVLGKLKYQYFLLVGILLILISFAISVMHDYSNVQAIMGRKVQKAFSNKLEMTGNYIQSLKSLDFEKKVDETSNAINNGISITMFKNGRLIFWSDNNMPVKDFQIDSIHNGEILVVFNSKYYVLKNEYSDTTVFGFINLENNYPYENKFLNNGISVASIVIPGEVIINSDEINQAYKIYDNNNNYVFSIIIDDKIPEFREEGHVLSSLFFFFGLFLLLFFIRQYLSLVKRDKLWIHITVLVILISLVRLLLLNTEIFREHFYLFDPFIYATRLAPTFGDLILNSILFLFFVYLLYHFVKIPKQFLSNSYNRNAWIGLLNTLFILILYIAYHTSVGIINHSSFNIVLHNISEITIPIAIAYLLIGILFFGVLLVGIWIFDMLKEVHPYKIILNLAVLLMVLFAASIAIKFRFDLFTVIFAIGLYVLITVLQKQIYANAIFTSLVLFLFWFSIYVIVFTVHYSAQKDYQHNKSFAISLSNEHDPIAEYLFEGSIKNMDKDAGLKELLEPNNFDFILVRDYLTRNYFSGYLKKYSLRITPCGQLDSVLIEMPQFNWYPCYDYFESYINDIGISIPGTPFYYLDNYTGLISYLAWIKFNLNEIGEVSLFLELDSRFTTEPLGYPELLLDQRLQENGTMNRVSYAKYYLGSLISHSGDYEYSLKSIAFNKKNTDDFYSLKKNGYNHLVYKPDGNSLIIISSKSKKALDLLVLFSYVFVFYYLFSLILIFALVSRFRHISFRESLRNKIQFYVVLVLILSLILIAGSTTWFNVRKYNQTQVRILKEKIQSVYVEIEHKLSYEQVLTADWNGDKYDNLEQLLTKFSDVFYTDINLYSPRGDLIASSRPEIFQIGLQNQKMAPEAYYKLHNEKLAQFIHREQIKNLSYLSAYVPFANAEGNLLAYLNLPYFTKQKELQEDISTLTVAIINIYVILILIAILVIVFISNQITKPLELLQAKFKQLKLGENYEKIDYEREDEIGRLVKEYNRMVTELEQSVELLARSERESAWREMAKQVAHEIKNPLTPMRLSVQQLQRSWFDKNENFEKYLNRVTSTLIEQIDNLSTIASEFSNFAKMPVAKMKNIDLNEVLTKVVELFKDNEIISVNYHGSQESLIVNADPEQLSRVFINIIKNGIQAIPDDKKGKIEIELRRKGNRAEISLKDNGKGITEDIRNKLFMPNFTTKSSGMGLGLAIVQNIVNHINGEINFSTDLGKGTTFYITIPLQE
ncbi:MAG: GHKL domain-containing protein [Bacteroidales bacterium]|nr:GHKL domain-containing protein [Bacteroidales bacterium]MBN2817477.1 GHKL domain-containing protein [Bacteroidales bacterium]